MIVLIRLFDCFRDFNGAVKIRVQYLSNQGFLLDCPDPIKKGPESILNILYFQIDELSITW